eukprot:GHUV01011760.1.p1 GENE.GHUV01011760.1~~GHUV01011760.1.p1  ORF type:complete len:130 (-),score=35.81 GHUV01011760.1:368-757(-)
MARLTFLVLSVAERVPDAASITAPAVTTAIALLLASSTADSATSVQTFASCCLCLMQRSRLHKRRDYPLPLLRAICDAAAAAAAAVAVGTEGSNAVAHTSISCTMPASCNFLVLFHTAQKMPHHGGCES